MARLKQYIETEEREKRTRRNGCIRRKTRGKRKDAVLRSNGAS